MMKIWKKAALFCLAAALCCNASACDQKGGGGEKLEYFTVPTTVKVCQDIDYEDKSSKQLTVKMAKNEYEGAQLVFRANEDISSYKVEVSPLKSGIAVLPEDAVSVYNEKYIRITAKGGNNPDYPVGTMVPDALLPFDAAVRAGENAVEEGNNQGVYIEVKTEAHTIPGTYTGSVKLTADGETYNVPISVKVYDIELPDSSEAQNFWLNGTRSHWSSQEMDSTDEMARLYLDKMLSYKLNGDLPFCGIGGIEAYVDLIREYYDKPGFSTYRFYYESVAETYHGLASPFSAQLLEDYLEAVAVASVEDKVNYLDKAMFYFYNFIDEPHTEEQYQDVYEVLSAYKAVLQNAAEDLSGDLVVHENYGYFVDTVYETLLNIPCVLPETSLGSKSIIEGYGVDNLTHCPLVNLLATEDARNYYDEGGQEEYWFYTCTTPTYPYPTLHLDDNLLGSVVLSWMQRAYGISGYVNWAVANYLGANNQLIDAYETSNRGFAPGDGFIFYPGLEYGVEGPVGSLRAVNLRDGIDDYDYICVLEDLYAARGMSADSFMETLYARLFNGAIPTGDPAVYASVKQELTAAIEEASDELGVIYGETSISGGIARMRFATVSDDAVVEYAGARLTPENGLYTIEADIRESGVVSFTVTVGDETRSISRKVSDTYVYFSGFEDGAHAFIGANSASSVAINENAAFVKDGERSLEILLIGSQDASVPFIALNEEFTKAVPLAETVDIELFVYNDSDTELHFTLRSFNGLLYLDVASYTLRPGWNSVVIANVNTLSDPEKIKGLYFMAENFSAEGGIPLYIDAISYTTTGGK